MGKRGQSKSDSLKESDRKRKKRDEATPQKASLSSKKAKEESNAKKPDQINKSKGDLQNLKKQEEKKETKEPINPKSEDAKDEDNEEESRQLDALLGDAPDVSAEKGFKRKQREEAALLQVPPVETDTEYDQPDISTFPEKLVIEGSSYDKLDGMYRILPEPSRGRPAYCKVGSSKNLYLYWYSGKRWQIGFEFGAKKCVASIQDRGALKPPLDPYPHTWKAIEKNSADGVKKEKPAKDKLKCLRMRVVEERLRQAATDFFEEMSPAVESAQKSRYETQMTPMAQEKEDSQEPEQEPSSSSQPSAPSKPAQSKTKTKAVKRPSPKKPAVSKVPKNLVVDEEAAIVMKHQQSDSDDESKATGKATSSQPSDSNAQTSDSESDNESTSSESVSEEEPDADFEAMGEQAQSIVKKLKNFEKNQAVTKFNQLMQVQRSKSKNGSLIPFNGCNVADMKHLFQWAMRHLGVANPLNTSALPQPAPRTPEQPQPRTPPPVEEEAPRSDAVAQLPHHTMAAPKSVLKKPGQPSGPVRRVQHAQEDFQVMVISHKSCGEGLWFQCPGSFVNCDTCDRPVPQAMGCLQGAPARSQFAQHLFLCQDCSSRPG